MILLDTNVISAPLRQSPNTQVVEWIDDQPLETLYLSAITSKARTAGLSVAAAHGYIAAIAAANGFSVATRDTRPFEAAGVAAINPWET